MPNCVICGCHFKLTPFNKSNECDDCLPYSVSEVDPYDQVEIDILVNKSGRIPAYIEDNETDCI